MNGIQITVIGNLTADPELRYTQSGLPVANFTIASTERTFNRQKNEWEDGDTVFLRTTAWRQVAEHAAASLKKGSRVVATGILKQRNYKDKDDNDRTSFELELDELAVSLRHGTTTFTKSQTRGENAPAAAEVADQGPADEAVSAPAAQEPAPRARATASQPAAEPQRQPATVGAAQAADDDLF